MIMMTMTMVRMIMMTKTKAIMIIMTMQMTMATAMTTAARRAEAHAPRLERVKELLVGIASVDDARAVVRAPPPPRTKWTRRVPHPVLIGHAASLTPPTARAPPPPWLSPLVPARQRPRV